MLEWENAAPDTEAPKKLVEWLEYIRDKRLSYRTNFLRWREFEFSVPPPASDDGIADAAKAIVINKQGDLDVLTRNVPEEHYRDFLVFLAWVATNQPLAGLSASVLLVAYLMLVKGVTIWSIATVRNDSRKSLFYRGLAYPLKVLDMLEPISDQQLSNDMIDFQIRVLKAFVGGENREDFQRDYDIEAGKVPVDDTKLKTAVRNLLAYHARRFSNALSRIHGDDNPAVPLTPEEANRPYFELPPLFVVEDNDTHIGQMLLEQPMYQLMQAHAHQYPNRRDLLGKQLLFVMTAYIHMMLAHVAFRGAEEAEYASEFDEAVKLLRGSFPDVNGIRRLYDELVSNPFVNYGRFARQGGADLFDVGKIGVDSVNAETVFGGKLKQLLDELLQLSASGSPVIPTDDLEQFVLSGVKTAVEKGVLDPSVISAVLTHTLTSDTVASMMRAGIATHLRFKRGTILKVDVAALWEWLRSKVLGFKNVQFSYEKSGSGPDNAVAYRLVSDDLSLNDKEGANVREDLRDGRTYLVIDDAMTDIALTLETDRANARFVLASVDGGETVVSQAMDYVESKIGDTRPKSTEFAMDMEAISVLLANKDTRYQAVPMLFERLHELRKAVMEHLPEEAVDLSKLSNYSDFKRGSIDGTLEKSARLNAYANAKAILTGRKHVDTYEDDKKRAEELLKEGRRPAFLKWGRQKGKAIKEGLEKAVSSGRTKLRRFVDDALGDIHVGRSSVCAPDETEPTELQLITKSAIENADKYLSKQYQMFGLWGIFNLMLVAVFFFLLYKIWEVLFQYYQFRSAAAEAASTPNSNNIFDPADDEYDVKPKAADIAKDRVPSGAAIESRLRRFSQEGGMNLSDAMDSVKDSYPKKVDPADDDDY